MEAGRRSAGRRQGFEARPKTGGLSEESVPWELPEKELREDHREARSMTPADGLFFAETDLPSVAVGHAAAVVAVAGAAAGAAAVVATVAADGVVAVATVAAVVAEQSAAFAKPASDAGEIWTTEEPASPGDDEVVSNLEAWCGC